jgi:hypothetical protein
VKKIIRKNERIIFQIGIFFDRFVIAKNNIRHIMVNHFTDVINCDKGSNEASNIEKNE